MACQPGGSDSCCKRVHHWCWAGGGLGRAARNGQLPEDPSAAASVVIVAWSAMLLLVVVGEGETAAASEGVESATAVGASEVATLVR